MKRASEVLGNNYCHPSTTRSFKLAKNTGTANPATIPCLRKAPAGEKNSASYLDLPAPSQRQMLLRTGCRKSRLKCSKSTAKLSQGVQKQVNHTATGFRLLLFARSFKQVQLPRRRLKLKNWWKPRTSTQQTAARAPPLFSLAVSSEPPLAEREPAERATRLSKCMLTLDWRHFADCSETCILRGHMRSYVVICGDRRNGGWNEACLAWTRTLRTETPR